MVELARTFVRALTGGHACLHPTDSLPGLAFDPASEVGRLAVLGFKGRKDGKPFVGLCPSIDTALRNWEPLPTPWEAILQEAWPAPLSVAYKASASAPRSLVATDNTIALRVPQLRPEHVWLNEVLTELGRPL